MGTVEKILRGQSSRPRIGGYITAWNANIFPGKSGDALVIKLNSTGEIIWQKADGDSTFDGADNSIQQTQAGGYITVGNGVWVLKLDNSGSIGSCPFEEATTAVVTDTADTAASVNQWCHLSEDLQMLKVASTRKRQGDGTITTSEGFINCPEICEAEYNKGVTVTFLPILLTSLLSWDGSRLPWAVWVQSPVRLSWIKRIQRRLSSRDQTN
jgi:hypothetical protein